MSPDLKLLRQRAERSFPAQCLSSFARLGGLDRAMVIASQAFTTLIPLLLVISTIFLIDDPDAVSDGMIRRLGLSGRAADEVEQVFGNADPDSVGVLSIILLVFSGVSFTRALLVEVALLSQLHGLVETLVFGWALTVVLSAVASMVLWTSIPWLLLGRRVEWRRLVPGGVLTGAVVTVYGAATTLYMPRLIETYSERYGLFGVTIALISWLLGISVIVVAATASATELDRAPQRWAFELRARLGIGARPAPSVMGPQEEDD